jgi:hypothetical protein
MKLPHKFEGNLKGFCLYHRQDFDAKVFRERSAHSPQASRQNPAFITFLGVIKTMIKDLEKAF